MAPINSSLMFDANIPSDGNPDGIIDAPQGSLFFKNGTFYKANFSGSTPSTWQDVYFTAHNVPDYYLTDADAQLLKYDTSTHLYVKNTAAGTAYGWKLLSNQSPFIRT